jgi:phosphatidylglycerophosphatase GEP4
MPLLSNLPALRMTVSYLLHDPASLLPHTTIPTLLSLPIPLSSSLGHPSNPPRIRALVIDKDNTLCPPKTALLHPAYIAKLEKIRSSAEFYDNPNSVLIVSNTAGSSSSTAHEEEARALEQELSIPVLRQKEGRKKPLCGAEVLAFFKENGVTDDPTEIAVVGDRLATDMLLAREMGSWSVWTKQGWRNPEMPGRDYRGFLSRMEERVERVLRGGLLKKAPVPKGYATLRKVG